MDKDLKKAWTIMWFAPIYILIRITKIIFDDEFWRMVNKIHKSHNKGKSKEK